MRPPSKNKILGYMGRFLAVGVAWLLFAAQFSQSFHLVLVRHTICAEHGEFVDAGVGGAASPAFALTNNGPPRGVAAQPGTRAVEAHEHCLVASHRYESVNPPAAHFALVDQRPNEGDIYHWADAPRRASDVLFRLAPKQSPPV